MMQSPYIRDLLFLLYIIYYAQGSLYTQGSSISQGALAIILGISGLYLVKTLLQQGNKNAFYKIWTVLLVLNVLGFIFTGTTSNPRHLGMFKRILVCSLSFYPFYYFAGHGFLKTKHLVRFLILILPISILQYFFNASQILAERSSDNTNLVNNMAYSFVGLIPFTFLIKRKILSIVVMLVLQFFIIQGAKRGAILTGASGLLVFIYFQLHTVEAKYKLRTYLLVLLAVVRITYYAYEVIQTNEFLVRRLESMAQSDGSSGRDRIYINIFNAWFNNNSSYFNLLFGFGFASSLVLSGVDNFAHNDWLELLSNYGLLGVIIYLALFIAAINYLLAKAWDINKKLVLIAILLIWFSSTLFSMFYTSMGSYLSVILLAYLFGNKNNYLE